MRNLGNEPAKLNNSKILIRKGYIMMKARLRVSSFVQKIEGRNHRIYRALSRTIQNAELPILNAIDEISNWIEKGEIVRVIAAGRSRIGSAMPANRLAHAGANVYILGDLVPLPNTCLGGNIIAASASGKTLDVLDIMRKAKQLNSEIRIIGIASQSAQEFRALTDIFIPIADDAPDLQKLPLVGLGDTSEHIICQVLDAIILAASYKAGLTDIELRRQHEDLGPTGPWGVENRLKV